MLPRKMSLVSCSGMLRGLSTCSFQQEAGMEPTVGLHTSQP